MVGKLSSVDPLVREMYEEIDAKFLPYIKSRVSSLSGVEFDDAVQEARVALLTALHDYDFNRAGGDYLPFMKIVLLNTCRGLWLKERRRSKTPWVAKRDGEDWVEGPSRPLSIQQSNDCDGQRLPTYDALPDENAIGGDHMICHEHSSMRVEDFKEVLEQNLSEFELEVYRCRVDAPKALIEQVKADDGDVNNIGVLDIAKFLGVGKNKVDWALYKIKSAFTEVAERIRFSDVFGDLVNSSQWPVVHVSKGFERNKEFVRSIIKDRNLSGLVLDEISEECESGARTIISYKWGVVVYIERAETCWTAVLEGSFNPRSGDLFGSCGARKLLPIEGYGQLAKDLADARRKGMASVNDDSQYDSLKVLPHCISEYEKGDLVCDGDENAEFDPCCVHRDNCVALQLRMKQKGMKKEQYVVEKTDSAGTPYCAPKSLMSFGKIVSGTIRNYGVRDGKATRTPKARPNKNSKAVSRHKELVEKATSVVVARSEGATIMDPWYERALEILCEKTGRTFCAGNDPSIGQFYAKDRRAKSGYVGVYCKTEKGRHVALFLLMYKPRTTTMDFKWPVSVDGFKGVGESTIKLLSPVKHSDGAFVSISKGLDGAGVSLAAESLSRMISNGTIVLP